LENHTHLTSEVYYIHVEYTFTVKEDLSLVSVGRIQVVHTVKASQKGGLSTAGGSDEGGYLPVVYGHVYVFEGLIGAVIEVEVFNLHAGL
jgi:hypothetical protein